MDHIFTCVITGIYPGVLQVFVYWLDVNDIKQLLTVSKGIRKHITGTEARCLVTQTPCQKVDKENNFCAFCGKKNDT